MREEFLQGMPTQAEMRKNPSGATDKHRLWQSRTGRAVQKWKHIRLRLHAGGDLTELRDASDIANIEQFRPVGGAQELGMQNTQIPGTEYHVPKGVPSTVVITDEQRQEVEQTVPELAGKIALMDAEQRRELIAILASGDAETQPVKRTVSLGWSPERRKQASIAAKKRHAEKAVVQTNNEGGLGLESG